MKGEELLDKVDPAVFDDVIAVNFSTLMGEIDVKTRSQILIIDCPLDDGKILKTVKKLRQKYHPSELVILCFSDMSETEHLAKLLDCGVSDFLVTPMTDEALHARLIVCVKNLQRNKSLRDAAAIDGLTGLPSRQRFFDLAAPVYANAKRQQLSTVVAIIAPDRLSEINDLYGQSVGDKVLKGIADILSNRLRETDLLCRIEGSKMCVFAVNMRESHLMTYLDDTLASFQANPFKVGLQNLWITASIGATTYLGRDINEMIVQAENALFQSRSDGGNRFTMINEIETEAVPSRSMFH